MFSNEPDFKVDVKTSGLPTLERGPKAAVSQGSAAMSLKWWWWAM